jgi:hypothetical protein
VKPRVVHESSVISVCSVVLTTVVFLSYFKKIFKTEVFSCD